MSLKDHIDKKNDKYSIGSMAKLKAAMKHKISKTFVGSLESIELEISKLNIDSRTRNNFLKAVRRRILGLGNDQIRNMEIELEKYNVEFIPYHVEFKSVEVKNEE